jgi:hypothetical protein
MRSVEAAPGLILNEDMYEHILEGVGRAAMQLAAPLTWERFTQRETWILVPDANRPDIPFYKAEAPLLLDPATLENPPWSRTAKLNVWYAPDLRKDGTPMPHSHPWHFAARILMGAYEEDRYAVRNGVVETETLVHRAGDTNTISREVYHEVTAVDPGRTLSLMDCAQGEPGKWGYLDPDTGLFTPNSPDPLFLQLLQDRNPHLK